MITAKCNIKKDDKVKVIAGKDKGKIGKVLKVNRKKNRILVRHTRPTAKSKQGGIVEGEAMLPWSNVMLMCSKCVQPTRIKMQRLEDGNKVRVCSKCKEIIDS
jgi:large subunit ribosomal protein L24